MRVIRQHMILMFIVALSALMLAGDLRPGPEQSFTILLSNDDGYSAPGLRALAEALAPLGTVFVAAPAQEQSGMGHAITYREAIMIRPVEVAGARGYAVEARPATCVRVGVEALLEEPPDLVVSGINSGENLGIISFMSGTVGAARQAAMLGIPAIAVSAGADRKETYAAGAAFMRELIEELRASGRLQPGLFLNVNIPAREIRGVRVVRQSVARDTENYERRKNPRGREYLWSGWVPPRDLDENTDVGAFAAGYITITPMTVDQTDAAKLPALRELKLELPAPVAASAAAPH